LLVCPGCGARNDAAARICEWCGRPFVDERPRLHYSWVAPIAAVGLVVLVGLTVMISLLGAMLLPTRTTEAPRSAAPVIATAEPPPVAVVEEPEPTAVALVTLVVVSTEAPVPAVEVTPEPVEFLRVGNTDRQGAFIRREPRTGAPGIVAHREGDILKVVGSDQIVDGRVWRNVEDQRGNRGWVPREYLLPGPTGF
jgi:hypothetical protein